MTNYEIIKYRGVNKMTDELLQDMLIMKMIIEKTTGEVIEIDYENPENTLLIFREKIAEIRKMTEED